MIKLQCVLEAYVLESWIVRWLVCFGGCVHVAPFICGLDSGKRMAYLDSLMPSPSTSV